jgi:hypothetical protein
MVGRAIDADASVEKGAAIAEAFFGGAFVAESWPKTATAAAVMDRHKISKRLRSAEFIPILLNVLNDVPTPYQTQLAVIGLHRIAKRDKDTLPKPMRTKRNAL